MLGGKISPRLVPHFLLCQCLWGHLFILHPSLVPSCAPTPHHPSLPLSPSSPCCPPSSAQPSPPTSRITPQIHSTGPQTGHSPQGIISPVCPVLTGRSGQLTDLRWPREREGHRLTDCCSNKRDLIKKHSGAYWQGPGAPAHASSRDLAGKKL